MEFFYFKKRRAALADSFDTARDFEAYEESCIPSYTHRHLPLAWAAWTRLTRAARLYGELAPAGPVLDFGAGSGELAPLLIRQRPEAPPAYHFAETNGPLATHIMRKHADATRVVAAQPDRSAYAAVFALDSLEHNVAPEPLIEQLASALMAGGVFIMSGPTENVLYRMGRRLAGFKGHYHHCTIYDLEAMAAKHLRRLRVHQVPYGAPLFRLSAWTQQADPGAKHGTAL